ncbi:MAG: hypothetical protein LIV24_09815 [Eubacterium sp.]|nr:hypothetical protein [Eubacterium sp.]
MHTRPLHTYIRKILQLSGTDILKEPRRFYAYLMDLATDHPEDVRCIVQNCDERFLNRFYRMRKSSMPDIKKAADGAAAYLHTEKSLSDKDAEKISLAFGMGLASYLHPDEKWPSAAPAQPGARKTTAAAATSAVRKPAVQKPAAQKTAAQKTAAQRSPFKNARQAAPRTPVLTERQKQKEREELRKSLEAEAELARIREQAVLQGRQKAGSGKTVQGSPRKNNWESQRWVPIWEQQPIGSSRAGSVSQSALPVRRKLSEPEEPGQDRRSEAVLSNERDARRKLHEETMRMFRRSNTQNTPSISPVSSAASAASSFSNTNDTERRGSGRSQVFPLRNSAPYDPALSDSTLQADLKVTTSSGDVLRTVMKGAKLPIQLTIYPRSAHTFSDGICLYEGHRLKYTLREEAPQTSESKRLIFTYTEDGTVADAVLYGTGSGKAGVIRVQKESPL